MRRYFSFLFLVTLFSLMPLMSVNAESREVTSQDELKVALVDATIDTIVIGNDISTTEAIDITRPVIIDGGGHKIELATDVLGVPVLQFNSTTGTVKNIKLTGGEGALNVNGSVVTLDGTIDVSGNSAYGIKLSMDGVTEAPDIAVDNVNIVNTTESSTIPTVLIDVGLNDIDDEDTSDVEDDFDIKSWPFKGIVYLLDTEQIQLFLSRDNIPTGENVLDVTDELLGKDTSSDVLDSEDESKRIQNREGDAVATENPNTYDGVIYYLIFAILSFMVLGYSYTKATSR